MCFLKNQRLEKQIKNRVKKIIGADNWSYRLLLWMSQDQPIHASKFSNTSLNLSIRLSIWSSIYTAILAHKVTSTQAQAQSHTHAHNYARTHMHTFKSTHPSSLCQSVRRPHTHTHAQHTHTHLSTHTHVHTCMHIRRPGSAVCSAAICNLSSIQG